MEKVSVEFNVYTYDELSEDAKQAVKEWHLNDPDRCCFFSDDLKNNLEYWFGKDCGLEVQFSLAYCQGDGVNVYGKIDPQRIFDCLYDDSKGDMFKEFRTHLHDDDAENFIKWADGYEVEIPYNNHYCYCMADYINLNGELSLQYSHCDCAERFYRVACNMFEKLCKHYEEWGYEYLYEISDEQMIEECDANEWKFFENGRLFTY